MTDSVEPHSVRHGSLTALDCAAALGCTALLWTLVRLGLTESAGAVEREHLATHAAIVLAALGLPWARTAPRLRLTLLAWAAPFLALVLLPPGLQRFAPVVVVALAGAVLWAWAREPSPARTPPSTAGQRLASLSTWVSAGVAVAILMRPDAVAVPLDVRDLGGVILRGAAFGGAAAWLQAVWRQRTDGALAALGVAGAALVFSGPSASAALVLAATAATVHWTRSPSQAGVRPHSTSEPRRLLARGALVLPPWILLAALAPPAAALLGFGAWGSRVRRGWLAALIVLTALASLWLAPRPWNETAVDLGFASLVLGAAWLARRAAGEDRTNHQLWRLASGLALAVVGLRFFPPQLVLVPVAVQLLRPGSSAADRASARGLGVAWIGSWVVAVALLASYPWMRPPMLAAQWRWALDGDARVMLLLLLLGALLAAGIVGVRASGGTSGNRKRRVRPTTLVALLALLCAALSAMALSWREPLRADLLQRWPPTTLNAANPSLEHLLEPKLSSADPPTVWLDGATAASLDVAYGTEIATVRVDFPSGLWQGSLVLGRDLWDWRPPAPRTRRPDPGPPAPLLFWWTGTPADTTLARRYRARLTLQRMGDGEPPWRLRIERHPDLPGPTTLEVHQLAINGARAAEGDP